MIQVGGLSSDPRERAVQLGLAPESAEIDVEIQYARGRVFLQAITMRAMRYLERRFFSCPPPEGLYRGAVFGLPVEQVELARAQLHAAGLVVASLQ